MWESSADHDTDGSMQRFPRAGDDDAVTEPRCDQIEPLLQAAHEETLDAATLERALAHVATCPRCGPRFEQRLHDVYTLVRMAPEVEPPPAIQRRLYARIAAQRSRTTPTNTTRKVIRPMRDTHEPPYPAEQASPSSTRPARRLGLWIGAALTVVIVSALAALLLSAAPGRHGPPIGGVPAAHGSPTVTHGRWVSLDPLAAAVEFDANDLPAIAPSDPRVVYESLVHGIQQHLPGALRRTDDGGATWHELPIPVPAAHVGHAGFLVSPVDARDVFLTLIDTQAEDCPPGTAQTNTEGVGVLCWLQYTSTDGGAHWQATKLPGSGWITPNLTNNNATSLQGARGSDGQPRLYALLNCPFGVTTCSRLLVSADRGLSWRYADAPLLAAGASNVCSTAADPQSATIYAVTTAGAECSWNLQLPLTLWRSDDAGGHWTNLGPLATPNLRGLRVAHDAPTGHALLYAAAPRTTQLATNKVGDQYPLFSADPSDLKASADGGVTWTSAPSAGIPADLMPYYDIGLLGVLSDGSVVVQCIPRTAQENFSGGVLFAWKPGAAAWRQLAQPLASEIGALTAVASASTSSGADTLYLVMVDRSAPGLGLGPGAPPPPTPAPGVYPSPGTGARPTFTFLRYDP
jgi:hypothetical protein